MADVDLIFPLKLYRLCSRPDSCCALGFQSLSIEAMTGSLFDLNSLIEIESFPFSLGASPGSILSEPSRFLKGPQPRLLLVLMALRFLL